MTWTGDDGQARHYDLADGAIELPVTSGDHKGEVLTLRQVTHRDRGARCTSSPPATRASCPQAGWLTA
jgi:hypothetical protein